MRILVTGAAGFIGSNVTDHLLAAGHDVVGLDNLSRGRTANLEHALRTGHFSFERFDVTDPDLPALAEQIRPEVICHLAAQIDVRVSVQNPVLDVQQNVVGTVNLLEAARRAGASKLVFASSGGSIYGSPERLPVTEDEELAPESPYAASKASCELFFKTFAALYGLGWTSLAFSNVYGPRQDHEGEAGVVALFASALLAGRTPTIFGDGTSTRDYVYVGDVANAFGRALAVGDGNRRRFNIGTGRQTSVADLYAKLAAIVGTNQEPAFAPARLGEVQASALDPSSAAEVLGWAPCTPLESGLVQTVEWLRGSSS